MLKAVGFKSCRNQRWARSRACADLPIGDTRRRVRIGPPPPTGAYWATSADGCVLGHLRRRVCVVLPPPAGAAWLLRLGWRVRSRPPAGALTSAGGCAHLRRRVLVSPPPAGALVSPPPAGVLGCHLRRRVFCLLHLGGRVRSPRPAVACGRLRRQYVTTVRMDSPECIRSKASLMRS